MIRPRFTPLLAALLLGCCGPLLAAPKHAPVSYTHLTLPTILRV